MMPLGRGMVFVELVDRAWYGSELIEKSFSFKLPAGSSFALTSRTLGRLFSSRFSI